MAFRTNKVPAIENRTVSGSSVSFNSAFALPLKTCKVSFSATQAGSGDPSPSNPRAISGVSAIGLTANSTPVSVSLGEERFGGYVDAVSGVLTVTHAILELDGSNDEVYTDYSSYGGFTLYVASAKSGTNLPCMANWLKSQVSFDEFGLRIGANSSRFYFLHITDNISGITDIATWRAYLSQHLLEIVYELAEPITIQLSPNELSSIIGNNTFSTDTGTLEITFADLQEKSASGAVATFNTALAMPLASCNIAVNAWQEGSGDPSPVNVRTIHGFSEVNVTRAGKNHFGGLTFANSLNGITTDYNLDTANKIVSFSHSTRSDSGSYIRPIFNKFKSDTRYTIIFYAKTRNENVSSSNIRIGYTDGANSTIPINSSERTLYIFTTTANKSVKDLTIAYNNNVLIDVYYDTFGVFEGIVTIDDFEPYTGNTYTIQLGQEVYGGSYNSVSGNKITNRKIITTDGTERITVDAMSIKATSCCGRFIVDDIFPSTTPARQPNGLMCDKLKFVRSSLWAATATDINAWTVYTKYIHMNISNELLGITDYTQETTATAAQKMEQFLADYKPVFLISTQEQTAQLTPQQIETIRGNNTIFADTGDVDLTFKDLDIAKRGNFREVFRLPS